MKGLGWKGNTILNPFTINSAITGVADAALQNMKQLQRRSPESNVEMNRAVSQLCNLMNDLKNNINAVNVATALHRVARLSVVSGHLPWVTKDGHELIRKMTSFLHSSPEELDVGVIVMSMWSLAKLGKRIKKFRSKFSQSIDDLFSSLINQAKQKPTDFTCSDITTFLQALVILQVHPGADFVEALASHAKNNIEHASNQALIRMPWYLVRLSYSDTSVGLLPFIVREVETRIHANDLAAKDLSILIAALAEFHWGPCLSLLDALESKTIASAHDVPHHDAVRLAQGFSSLGYLPSKRLLLSFISCDMIGQYTPQQLTSILESFADFGMKHNELVNAVKAKLYETDMRDPEQLAQACDNFALLDALDSSTFSRVLAQLEGSQVLTVTVKEKIWKGFAHVYCTEGPSVLCVNQTLQACKAAWQLSEEQRVNCSSFHTSLKQLQVSEHSWVGNGLFYVAKVLPKGGQDYVVESSELGTGFMNHPKRLRGEGSWRVRMLRRLGWKVLWIDSGVWQSLSLTNKQKHIEEQITNIHTS